MYSNNFVVAIKVNGKVLRELQDIVYLPFGTEYSILLKNTSPQRAQVKVSIDGTDVTEDVHLIVNGNDSLELKRFIKNGNLSAGNAFKFIEKTSKIEEFRGNKAEDGLITVTYEFERKPTPLPDYYGTLRGGLKGGTWGGGCGGYAQSYTNSALLGSNSVQTFTSTSFSVSDDSALEDDGVQLRSRSVVQTAGITAPGAVVEQAFNLVSGFPTDGVKHVMTMQLKGKTDEEVQVTQPVVVKKVLRCTMCGTNTRQTAKFCHECGASVQLV